MRETENEQLCGSKERKGGKAGRAVPNTDCQKSIFSNSSIILLPVLFLFSFCNSLSKIVLEAEFRCFSLILVCGCLETAGFLNETYFIH